MNKKYLSIAAAIALSIPLFTGCGGSNGGSSSTATTTTQETTPETRSTKVDGIISDGPIYGATVEIINPLTGKVLGSITTSAIAGFLGSFGIEIDNLPETFVIASKGGTDSGADGIINGNDRENGSEIKTVAENLLMLKMELLQMLLLLQL